MTQDQLQHSIQLLQEQLTYYVKKTEGLEGRVAVLETEIFLLKSEREARAQSPATVRMEHGAGGVKRIPKPPVRGN